MRIDQRGKMSATLGTLLTTGLVLGLSACGSDELKESADSVGQSGGSPSSSAATPAPTTSADADDSDASATPAGCLVGTWLMDNKHFGALLKGAADSAGASGTMTTPTGKALVTFAVGGKYNTSYEDLTMKFSQDGMTIDLVRKGTDKGTYRASDDGTLTFTETTMNSTATMRTAAGSHSIKSEPSSTTGKFACQGKVLKVTAEGATSILNRQ